MMADELSLTQKINFPKNQFALQTFESPSDFQWSFLVLIDVTHAMKEALRNVP